MSGGGMPGGGAPGMTEVEPVKLQDLAKRWREFSDEFEDHKSKVTEFSVESSHFPFASAGIAGSYRDLSSRLEQFFKDGGSEFSTIADKLDEAAIQYGETEDENTQLAANAAEA